MPRSVNYAYKMNIRFIFLYLRMGVCVCVKGTLILTHTRIPSVHKRA